MDTELIQLVEAVGGQHVLLVGDFMLDCYIFGDAERISPEAPVPVLRAVEEQHRVGGAGSVAANLHALELEVHCFGLMGSDSAGRQLLELLRSSGAHCAGLLTDAQRPTTTKTRLVGLAQHRHRQQLLRLDQEHVAPVSAELAGRLVDHVTRMLADADLVCLEDYNKGLLIGGLASEVIARARAAGRRVLVDPASIDSFERDRGATLLTPNRNELAVALQTRFDGLEDMGAAAADMASRLELEAVVVTVDREGAVLATPDGRHEHVPTRPRAVYDNTGAGDAVLAMMAAALAAGADFRQAAQLANTAGGLEVEKFGCVPIRRNEVLAELRIEQRRRVGKLRSLEDLVSEVALRRDRGETVGFTNGCFDLLHRGHVEYLRACAEHADILVVGLNSDESVRGLAKAMDRPVVAQQDRAAVLAALEAVDYVVIFDEPTPENAIRSLRPNFLMKGADWEAKGVVGREFVEAGNGRVELIPLVEGYSTTALIERIRSGVVPH